jgi:hypothetical protein
MPAIETGFRCQYSVEKSEDKGLGVFAREPIKKGSIVWRHVSGLYVVYDERSFKAKIEKMSSADVIYELTHVFGLADFPDCLIRILDDGVLINHSSDANLIMNISAPASISLDVNSRTYLHGVTMALLDDRYALMATRDIERGEEFTTDYSADLADPTFYDVLYEQYGVCEDYLSDR